MFLISDKMEKTDIKYDLVDEEKRDLTKEEKILVMQAPKKCSKYRFISTILITSAFLTALWIMLSPKREDFNRFTALQAQVLNTTNHAVNNTDMILSKVQAAIPMLTQDNMEYASKYVKSIEELLTQRTRYSIVKINQMAHDRIREIENELTSFDYVITEASAGIMEYTLDDIRQLRESVSSINADDTSAFENLINNVTSKMESAFTDLDQMYTFYGSYLGDIIDKKVENVTDAISKLLVSNRRSCESTLIERINFCYNISRQNVKVVSLLEALMKVIGALNSTNDLLTPLEPALLENTIMESHAVFSKARTAMNSYIVKSEQMMDDILKDDTCFLGTITRKESYRSYNSMKKFIQHSYETSIQSLATDLNNTISDFTIVKEKHWKEVKEGVIKSLAAIGSEIKKKAESTTNQLQRDDHMKMADFSALRLELHNKYRNATEIINPLFEEKKSYITEGLKYTLQYIIFQQLPFISSLSIQNYVPSDVCPLSTDYQKFAYVSLDQYLYKDEETRKQIELSADYLEDGIDEMQQELPSVYEVKITTNQVDSETQTEDELPIDGQTEAENNSPSNSQVQVESDSPNDSLTQTENDEPKTFEDTMEAFQMNIEPAKVTVEENQPAES